MKTRFRLRLSMLLSVASFLPVHSLSADDPKSPAADEKATTQELPAARLEAVTLTYPTSTTGALLATISQSDSRIGVELAPVSDLLRSHLGLAEGKGLVVTSVGDDSPAAKAGIQKNDVLITVAGEEITGLEAFRKALEAAADKPVSIGFIRAGKKQSVEVTPHSTQTVVAFSEPKYWLGVGLVAADDTLRSQLSLHAGEGLVVTSVESESPAAKAGVMVNDLLLKLDGKALTTIEALTEQLQAIADKSASLELLRLGKPATLTVTPEKRAATLEAVHFVDLQPYDLIWTTQQLQNPYWQVHLTQPFNTQPINIAYEQVKPDLAKQVSDLEAQVKQLEAALAALRTAIEAAAQPAPSGEQKK